MKKVIKVVKSEEMDLIQFDPKSIVDEFGQLCAAINVKQEQDEEFVSYSSAAKSYAKQVTPNVIIDVTDEDPIIMKTDPDQNNLIPNRHAAFENVPKKTSETIQKPMKPLIHRCVGKIFGPSNRRRDQFIALLRQQASDLLRQLDGGSEGTQYANEGDAENIGDMGEQDKENELPTAIIDSTQAEMPMLHLDPMTTQPDISQAQPTQQQYCSYCRRSFTSKRGLMHHINKTKLHAENVIKSQMERAMAANSQNGI